MKTSILIKILICISYDTLVCSQAGKRHTEEWVIYRRKNLIDSQFSMAVEASGNLQSLQKVKWVPALHMAGAGERAGEVPHF